MGNSLTASTPLPGAIFKEMDFEQYCRYAKEKYKWMNTDLLNHYLYTYGSRMETFLAPCNSTKSLGKKYCTYLYQVEVDYLILEEWAQSCDDILKRRTKLNLIIEDKDRKELAHYLSRITSYPSLEAPLLLH